MADPGGVGVFRFPRKHPCAVKSCNPLLPTAASRGLPRPPLQLIQCIPQLLHADVDVDLVQSFRGRAGQLLAGDFRQRSELFTADTRPFLSVEPESCDSNERWLVPGPLRRRAETTGYCWLFDPCSCREEWPGLEEGPTCSMWPPRRRSTSAASARAGGPPVHAYPRFPLCLVGLLKWPTVSDRFRTPWPTGGGGLGRDSDLGSVR